MGGIVAAAGLLGLLLAACGGSTSPGPAKKNNFTIALSDSYIGNAWRQTMVAEWTKSAQAAKAQGLISSYRVDITAENTVSAQIAQIDSLILAHVSAIDIDSASATALNPAITKACQAGIKVVVFDSLASAPCEYNLFNPFSVWGAALAKTVATGMNGSGNVILVQGVVGSQPNGVAVAAQKKVLAGYPGIHIVATVDGEASTATTESAVAAVLPSLGNVQGVISQGGAGGILTAFAAAHRPAPVVAFDTFGTSLVAWTQALQANPSFKASALGTDPGQSSAALWESVLLLEGPKSNGSAIPHNLTWPLVEIPTSGALAEWMRVTPSTGVASYGWTLGEVKAGIADNLAGRAVPTPPIPLKTVG
ncbi:MAG TPA: substrate-binding domain-containing protein [Candidatus Acidoferrales bacterium]|nr:substrate-binding domain-containing protein [Candidatus Acidoferrales bacterium]